jgi:hypothetical protein
MTEVDELRAFFTYTVGVLERLEMPYMVVGGYAATLHGEPRLTLDVDIVVDMRREHINAFVAAFPSPDYYVSEESIRDSLARRYPFNVIESATAAKVDFVPLPRDAFTRMAFQRRQRVEYGPEGRTAAFILPEDLVVAKLIAHRNTESDRHLRDARGVLIIKWGDLNLDLIRQTARAAGVLEAFDMILMVARREVEGEQGEGKRE